MPDDICPTCGLPTDGGPGPECIEAERKFYADHECKDKILAYVTNNPGKWPEEIAEALKMNEHEVSKITRALLQAGLLATA